MTEKRFCKYCGQLVFVNNETLKANFPWGTKYPAYWNSAGRGFDYWYCDDERCTDPSTALFHMVGSNLEYLEMKSEDKI